MFCRRERQRLTKFRLVLRVAPRCIGMRTVLEKYFGESFIVSLAGSKQGLAFGKVVAMFGRAQIGIGEQRFIRKHFLCCRSVARFDYISELVAELLSRLFGLSR